MVLKTHGREFECAYKCNSRSSNLVIDVPVKDTPIYHQMDMLINNSMGGVLNMNILVTDEKLSLYYNVTSRLTLGKYLSLKKLNRLELMNILVNITTTIRFCDGYMLYDRCFVFNEDYVFIDPVTLRTFLVYIPLDTDEDFLELFKKLVLDIITRLARLDDQPGDGNYIQVIIENLKSETFNIRDFWEMLNDMLDETRRTWDGAELTSDMHESAYEIEPPHTKPAKDAKQEEFLRKGGKREDSLWKGGRREDSLWKGGKREDSLWKGGKREDSLWEGGKRGNSLWKGGKRGESSWKDSKLEETLYRDINGSGAKVGDRSMEDGNPVGRGLNLPARIFAVIATQLVMFIIYLYTLGQVKHARWPGSVLPGAVIILAAVDVLLLKNLMGRNLSRWLAKKPWKKTSYHKSMEANCPQPSQLSWQPQQTQQPLKFRQSQLSQQFQPSRLPSAGGAEIPCYETEVLGKTAMGVPVLRGFGEARGEEIPIVKSGMVIGRLPDLVDFVVQNMSVGKVHAEIISRDGEYYIRDLNSRNGTYINGEKINSNTDYRIKNGDTVTLANCDYEFIVP